MNFNQPPQSPEEILKVISRANSGRRALERFLPLFHSRKITIQPYPLEIIAQLRALIGPEQPIGACFTNDGETGTIYVDMSSPLGILAPFLYHEIIHSLDASVWKAASRPLTRAQKDEVFLQAEVKAFEGQHEFMQELKERFPEYREFLAAHYPKAKILHDRLTATDISDLYGFKVS